MYTHTRSPSNDSGCSTLHNSQPDVMSHDYQTLRKYSSNPEFVFDSSAETMATDHMTSHVTTPVDQTTSHPAQLGTVNSSYTSLLVILNSQHIRLTPSHSHTITDSHHHTLTLSQTHSLHKTACSGTLEVIH